MQNKVVVLEKTVMGHRPYKQLEFREPRFGEWSELGEPFIWVPAGEYSRRVEDTKIIGQYAERLIVEDGKPGDPLVLQHLGIVDVRRVRDAILSFFPGSGVTEASATSEESSSSTSNGMQEPSTP